MKVKYMNTEETYHQSSGSSKLNDERKIFALTYQESTFRYPFPVLLWATLQM